MLSLTTEIQNVVRCSINIQTMSWKFDLYSACHKMRIELYTGQSLNVQVGKMPAAITGVERSSTRCFTVQASFIDLYTTSHQVRTDLIAVLNETHKRTKSVSDAPSRPIVGRSIQDLSREKVCFEYYTCGKVRKDFNSVLNSVSG